MRFRYIAACLVEGLQSPADGFISLYSNEAEGKKVFLSGNTHENWNHIDTVHTIANITLKSMFQGGIFDLSQLKSYVTATTEERVRRYGPAAAFLIVEASYADETGRIGTIGQSDQREFCLALPNGFMGEVEARHRAFLEKSQALLSFVIPSVAGLQFAGKCVVADHPSGKPLYVMTFGMNARPSISKPIPTDGPELFARLFQDSVALEYFQTAFRLAAGSTSNARDNLRAFLFAFTALDSFELTSVASEALTIPGRIDETLSMMGAKWTSPVRSAQQKIQTYTQDILDDYCSVMASEMQRFCVFGNNGNEP
jgi:hypothetical protein